MRAFLGVGRPGSESLSGLRLCLLSFQVVRMMVLLLTAEQVVLQVTCRSLNRTCLCECPVGQWYVIRETAIAEPENGFALLAMCWLLLAL